jgi:hypothetical protein
MSILGSIICGLLLSVSLNSEVEASLPFPRIRKEESLRYQRDMSIDKICGIEFQTEKELGHGFWAYAKLVKWKGQNAVLKVPKPRKEYFTFPILHSLIGNSISVLLSAMSLKLSHIQSIVTLSNVRSKTYYELESIPTWPR